jgi:hypothetical protein
MVALIPFPTRFAHLRALACGRLRLRVKLSRSQISREGREGSRIKLRCQFSIVSPELPLSFGCLFSIVSPEFRVPGIPSIVSPELPRCITTLVGIHCKDRKENFAVH